MACITPYHVKDKHSMCKIPVPCGKCPECRSRRISGWSFRLEQESRRSLSAWFVTLTYGTESVPITNKGFMTLYKPDLQNFYKRLRKISNEKLKYYACGEYGSKSFRPHYHMILFNAQVADIDAAWSLKGVPIGNVHFGDVNGASIGYCLKYMSKVSRIPMHANDDRISEFSLMSKRLGSNYLTDAMIDWHKSDLNDRMHLVLKDGRKIAMPRYYKDKLYTDTERSQIAFYSSIEAKKREVETELKYQKKFGDNWRSILANHHRMQFKRMDLDAQSRTKI